MQKYLPVWLLKALCLQDRLRRRLGWREDKWYWADLELINRGILF